MSLSDQSSLRVLVVDDEESLRHSVKRALDRAGHAVLSAEDGEAALRILKSEPLDLVITDLRMPKVDGEELFRLVQARHPGLPVIMMTAHGTIADAVKAMQAGAESYLEKPFERDALLVAVQKAAEKRALRLENESLKARLLRGEGHAEILGQSSALLHMLEAIALVSQSNGLVLLSGESGSGKELAARAIHRASPMGQGPFVAVHCGALPAGLLEPELFGVSAGAFTGAAQSRPGYIERAEGGTLFLDEIGEIPREAQVTLLRFLQDGEVVRLGGTEVRKPRLRIIAATQKDLRAEVSAGRFREDLFFRFNVLPVHVPPLRERREDIPLLFEAFLLRAGRSDLTVDPALLEDLQSRPWPGNVRELQNLAERLAATVLGSQIGFEDLPEDLALAPGQAPRKHRPYRLAMEEFERNWLIDLLRRADGNSSEAARLGGIPRATLHARLKHLGIDPKDLHRQL